MMFHCDESVTSCEISLPIITPIITMFISLSMIINE